MLANGASLVINNFLVENAGGFMMERVGITANNVSIINSTSDVVFLIYSTFNAHDRATLNNFLITNNRTIWDFEPIMSFESSRSNVTINNMTIANNSGSRALYTAGNIVINNSIFYNPEIINSNEIRLGNHSSIEINNSLIYKIGNVDDLEEFAHDTLFNTSPRFLGMHDSSLSPNMWEYYQLHETSPCVNAGLEDISHLNLPELDLAGNPRVHDGRIDMGAFEFQGTVSVDDENEMPILTALIGNFPNPFNPSTTIKYTIGSMGNVRLNIYNVRGQRIKTLVDEVKEAGFHSTIWNGEDQQGRSVASGVYFYRLETSTGNEVKKMMLMK